ncbi:MAG: response regulator transcription factor [Anaerolineae bacterium]|nr:response regulator transcription factor [Anaerolineae bacterium]
MVAPVTELEEVSILAVDDNPETLLVVEHTLRRHGFSVSSAPSGETALDRLARHGLPHLAVVDMNMPPGMNGFAFCEQLSRFSDVPVIILTAVDEEQTVVRAIRQYAEDYVIKPFNPGELAARVRRVLQRVGTFPFAMRVPLCVDEHLMVNFAARELIIDGKSRKLTPTEARLLYILMRTPGETVSSDYILRRMWPLERSDDDRLHVYIHRLRSKLKGTGSQHRYVVSERGVGYRFQPCDIG